MKLTAITLIIVLGAPLWSGSKPPAPAGVSIRVEGLGLSVPDLPANVAEANAKNSAFHSQLTDQVQDLTADLKRLYALPGALNPNPRLRVPKERAEEARFLASLLTDGEYQKLESEMLASWNKLQNHMLRQGLASEGAGVIQAQDDPLSEVNAGKPRFGDEDKVRSQDRAFTEEEKKTNQFAQSMMRSNSVTSRDTSNSMSARNYSSRSSIMNNQIIGLDNVVVRMDPDGANPLGAGTVDPDAIGSDQQMIGVSFAAIEYKKGRENIKIRDWTHVTAMVDRMENNADRVSRAIVGRKISNEQAPELAKLWHPMAEHLNACNAKLLEYERLAPKDEPEEMKQLRLQAKTAFLDRFRSALWFSSVVWANMSSRTPPPPMEDLSGFINLLRMSPTGEDLATLPPWDLQTLPKEYLRPQRSSMLIARIRSEAKDAPMANKEPWPGVDGFLKAQVSAGSHRGLAGTLYSLALNSPEFQEVLKCLWVEQPGIRMEFQPMPASMIGSAPSCGDLLVTPTAKGYDIVVLVQTSLAEKGMDQMEPWVAQMVYAVLLASRSGGVRDYQKGLAFNQASMMSLWDFQGQLRSCLKLDHPESYEILVADGRKLFNRWVR